MRSSRHSSASVSLLAANKEVTENAQRVQQAADVFSEIMATPDKAIPQELLESAYCLVIVPSLKQGPSSSAPNTESGTSLAE